MRNEKLGQPLPPELVSLVQHVELNKSGWWDFALGRLIIASLWIEGRPLSFTDVCSYIRDNFHVTVDSRRVSDQARQLVRSGDVVELPDQRLKVSERAYGRFEAEVRDDAELRSRVKERFVASLTKCCPKAATERSWDLFNQYCLLPWIKNTGARVYSMVSGDPFDIEHVTDLQPFLALIDEPNREGMRRAVSEFIDPMTPDVRKYVLGYLGTVFVLESSSLRVEALSKLVTGKTAEFRVFLDTNFLFSMLGLHDNPSDAAAESVARILSAVQGKVHVKLYIAPITVDEMKRALHARISPLKTISFSDTMVDAAIPQLSGIERKYLSDSKAAGRKIDPEEYFGPYLHDLIAVLREHGVELYNESMDAYRLRQDVLDDVTTRLEFEKRHLGERAKSYEQLLHDVALWHFACDKRPAVVESPIDAQVWILTVDYRFMGFDSFKTKAAIPLCLHPASFVQLLQFWIPRSEQFEEALLGSLGLSNLFRANADTERVTIQILDSISRFENATDIPQETLSRLLVNEALRRKLKGTKDIEEQVQFVREALIEENNRIATALAATAKREKELEEALKRVEAEKRESDERLTNEAAELKAQAEARAQREEAARRELATVQSAYGALEQQHTEIEKALRERDVVLSRNKARIETVGFALFGVLLAGVLRWLLLAIPPSTLSFLKWKPSFVTAVGVSLAVTVWLLAVENFGKRLSAVRDAKWFAQLVAIRGFLLGGGGIGAIIITLYFEYLRSTY